METKKKRRIKRPRSTQDEREEIHTNEWNVWKIHFIWRTHSIQFITYALPSKWLTMYNNICIRKSLFLILPSNLDQCLLKTTKQYRSKREDLVSSFKMNLFLQIKIALMAVEILVHSLTHSSTLLYSWYRFSMKFQVLERAISSESACSPFAIISRKFVTLWWSDLRMTVK